MPVVYDGVGKDTFPASLDCLSPRGMFVSYGNASGPVPPFDILLLVAEGFAVRRRGRRYSPTPNSRASIAAMAKELFDLVAAGKIKSAAAADVRAQGCGRRAPRAGIARYDGRERAALPD